MEQEDAGNGVGDVGSADIQLIWKNSLSARQLSHYRPNRITSQASVPNLPSQQSGGTDESPTPVHYSK